MKRLLFFILLMLFTSLIAQGSFNFTPPALNFPSSQFYMHNYIYYSSAPDYNFYNISTRRPFAKVYLADDTVEEGLLFVPNYANFIVINDKKFHKSEIDSMAFRCKGEFKAHKDWRSAYSDLEDEAYSYPMKIYKKNGKLIEIIGYICLDKVNLYNKEESHTYIVVNDTLIHAADTDSINVFGKKGFAFKDNFWLFEEVTGYYTLYSLVPGGAAAFYKEEGKEIDLFKERKLKKIGMYPDLYYEYNKSTAIEITESFNKIYKKNNNNDFIYKKSDLKFLREGKYNKKVSPDLDKLDFIIPLRAHRAYSEGKFSRGDSLLFRCKLDQDNFFVLNALYERFSALATIDFESKQIAYFLESKIIDNTPIYSQRIILEEYPFKKDIRYPRKLSILKNNGAVYNEYGSLSEDRVYLKHEKIEIDDVKTIFYNRVIDSEDLDTKKVKMNSDKDSISIYLKNGKIIEGLGIIFSLKKSFIEIDENMIIPSQTDSIKLGNYTGYPHKDKWLFRRNEGAIKLFSDYPLSYVCYIEKDDVEISYLDLLKEIGRYPMAYVLSLYSLDKAVDYLNCCSETNADEFSINYSDLISLAKNDLQIHNLKEIKEKNEEDIFIRICWLRKLIYDKNFDEARILLESIKNEFTGYWVLYELEADLIVKTSKEANPAILSKALNLYEKAFNVSPVNFIYEKHIKRKIDNILEKIYKEK